MTSTFVRIKTNVPQSCRFVDVIRSHANFFNQVIANVKANHLSAQLSIKSGRSPMHLSETNILKPQTACRCIGDPGVVSMGREKH